MKYTKYIVAVFLLIFSITVYSEINYLLILSDKSGKFESVSVIENSSQSTEISDYFTGISEFSNIGFFVMKTNQGDMFRTEISLYCAGNAEQQIRKEINIPSKTTESLMYKTLSVSFYGLEQYKGAFDQAECYFTGNHSEIIEYKRKIEKENGIRLSIKSRRLILKCIHFVPAIPWILYFLIVLFYSTFEIEYSRKKKYIKILFGNSQASFCLYQIAEDTIFFSILYSAEYIILNRYHCYAGPVLRNSALTFSALCFADAAMLVMSHLKIDKECVKILSNPFPDSKKLISKCRLIKVVSLFLFSFMVSVIISSSYQWISILKAEPEIKKLKDYSFGPIQVEIKDLYDIKNYDITNEHIENVYRTYYDKCGILNLASYGSGNIIYANPHAYNIVVSAIREFDPAEEKDLYFLIPDSVTDEEDVLKKMKDAVHGIEGDEFSYTYEIIKYRSGKKLMYFDSFEENAGIRFAKNPYVIYNSIDPATLTTDMSSTGRIRMSYDMLLNFGDDDEISDEIIEKCDLKSIDKTNIYELFMSFKRQTEKLLCYLIMTVLYLFFINIMILFIIAKTEYSMYAREKTLKKIHGYSLFERWSDSLFSLLTINIISFILSLLLYRIAEIPLIYDRSLQIPAIVSFSLLISDIAVFIVFAVRDEKRNIIKVLKGGAL